MLLQRKLVGAISQGKQGLQFSQIVGIHKRNLHICVVGSGPAGFYTADRLLKSEGAKVDVIERFPVPYGLARFGVAPDHPEVKICTNKFESVALHPNCRFYGNVQLGKNIQLKELQQHYDVIVLSYGAESDRRLGIPGELCTNGKEGKGGYSARSFVGWYNGHPDHADLNPDLSGRRAVVIGQGNVALDVARILLSPLEELAKTDITSYALDALAKSKVKEVVLLGRRGPVQAAFTIKEFRELTKLSNTQLVYDNHSEVLRLLEEGRPQWTNDRSKKRLMELLEKSGIPPSSANPDSRKCIFKFLRSPVAIKRDGDDRVTSLVSAINRLEGENAVATAEAEEEECSLVFRSIGYRSVAVPGVPFDQAKGLVPNSNGRVLADAKSPTTIPGLYTSGWLKRGPTGVIVSTMMDAQDTAANILEDLSKGQVPVSQEKKGGEALAALLKQRGVSVVSFEDWKRIDAAEVAKGAERQAPREKVVDIKQMLALAGK